MNKVQMVPLNRNASQGDYPVDQWEDLQSEQLGTQTPRNTMSSPTLEQMKVKRKKRRRQYDPQSFTEDMYKWQRYLQTKFPQN